jgi:glutaredoxin
LQAESESITIELASNQRPVALPNLSRRQELTQKVVLYTHPDCSYSDALKSELDEVGTVYDEINLALNPEAWTDLEALTGGERITPVLIEGEAVSVGYHGVG